MIAAEARHSAQDISRIMLQLGFEPSPTGHPAGVAYERRWTLRNAQGTPVGVFVALALFEAANGLENRPRWTGIATQWQSYISPDAALLVDWPRMMPLEVETVIADLAARLRPFKNRHAAVDKRVCVRCGEVTTTFAPGDDGGVACLPACR